jgi:hypothetical protein
MTKPVGSVVFLSFLSACAVVSFAACSDDPSTTTSDAGSTPVVDAAPTPTTSPVDAQAPVDSSTPPDASPGTDGSTTDGSTLAPLVLDLNVNGTAVTNAKLVAAGWAYSQHGSTLANVVRLTFTALGNNFEAELAVPKSAAANAPCFVRAGGGGTFFASTRTGGSCTSTATAAVELGTPATLTFDLNGTLSSAAGAEPVEPAAKVQVRLTDKPKTGSGSLALASFTLTGKVSIAQSVLSHLDATINGTAKRFIALEQAQAIDGGQTRPSVLGVRPLTDSSGAFTGYEFLQVLFANNDVAAGGSCETSGPVVLYKGTTGTDQVPLASLENSYNDAPVNCSVTATETSSMLTGTFAGTTKSSTDTSVITAGSYTVFR